MTLREVQYSDMEGYSNYTWLLTCVVSNLSYAGQKLSSGLYAKNWKNHVHNCSHVILIKALKYFPVAHAVLSVFKNISRDLNWETWDYM